MRKKCTIGVYYPSFATLGPVVDRKDPEIAVPARGRTAPQKRENLKDNVFSPISNQYWE